MSGVYVIVCLSVHMVLADEADMETVLRQNRAWTSTAGLEYATTESLIERRPESALSRVPSPINEGTTLETSDVSRALTNSSPTNLVRILHRMCWMAEMNRGVDCGFRLDDSLLNKLATFASDENKDFYIRYLAQVTIYDCGRQAGVPHLIRLLPKYMKNPLTRDESELLLHASYSLCALTNTGGIDGLVYVLEHGSYGKSLDAYSALRYSTKADVFAHPEFLTFTNLPSVGKTAIRDLRKWQVMLGSVHAWWSENKETFVFPHRKGRGDVQ